MCQSLIDQYFSLIPSKHEARFCLSGKYHTNPVLYGLRSLWFYYDQGYQFLATV